jgi:pilus assembly protein Flp/PilA
MLGLQKLVIAAMTQVACPRDEERGATAVEYALIVALIAGLIIAAVALIGTRTQGGFNSVTVNFPA